MNAHAQTSFRKKNLINRIDLFICLHMMFQISFQNSTGQKSYCKFLGVRSEVLLSIYVYSLNVLIVRLPCIFAICVQINKSVFSVAVYCSSLKK